MMGVRLLFFIIGFLFFCNFSGLSQQIRIENFTSVSIDKADKVKGKRVIDFYMQDEGYTFSSSEGNLEEKKDEGYVRLVVSKDVRYIKISHPKFGAVNWKIPVSKLKARKLYKAEIVSPLLPEYKQRHQWLKIICPYKDAIVVVDSLYKRVENNEIQLLLPVGKHVIKVIAAFFKNKTDSVFLNLEKPVEYKVQLVPDYSFLQVDYNVDSIKVFINNKEERKEDLRRKKLAAGTHYLYAKYKELEYAKEIILKPSEFQVISLDISEFYSDERQSLQPSKELETEIVCNPKDNSRNEEFDLIPVTIKAFDERCSIYINNEYVKEAFWSGYLNKGDYLISNKRDGFTSKPIFVHIQDQDRVDLSLNSPLSNYGDLNIESNVINADIILNGSYIGKTPYIIKNLETDKEHTVVLQKKGYKLIEKKLKVTPNSETRIVFTLYKK